MVKNIFKFICFLLISLTFFVFPISKTIATENYNILFLTSYTPGNKVFDQQLLGIQKAFSSDSNNTYKLYVEYMDTSNLDMSTNYSNFKDLLDLKSYIYNDIDAIIVGDNITLEFLISLDGSFNDKVHKFFLGINDKKLIDSAIKSGFSDGVATSVSIDETINSINIITKQSSKNLVLILPKSNLYKDELKTFYSVSKKYDNFKFSHMYIPDILDKNLLTSIDNLNNKNTIILFLGPYKQYMNLANSSTNNYYTFLNLLDVPVFNLVNYFDFDYFVGGKVIDFYKQGFELGNLVLNKLNFNSPPTFINFESANKWIFNYTNLKQFNLKGYKIPNDVEIVGAPIPLYKQPLENILPLIVVIFLLLLIIWWLCIHMVKKQKYEKELYAAKQHAEDMNLAKNNFISNISHELRTPVAVIMSSSQLLKRLIVRNTDLNIESINHNFDIMEQNSNRLLRLVNNIIDVAKIDSGIIDLNLQNINIIDLVEDTVLSIVPYAQIKNIDVIFDTYIEELIVAVDVEKIERVLLNLLSNAIKFSNYNGSIYAKVSTDTKNIVITIKDSGIGIDKEHLECIFKKFNQVDNGFTRHNEGSGIGLSIVKSFITLHGGDVFVNSVKGLGTTFTLILPSHTVPENICNSFLSSDKNVEIELSDIYFDRYTNN